MEGRRGWSVLLKESAQWVELEGSDYVLDLMSDLELPPDFPKHSSYFIISAQEPTRVRPNASMWETNHHAHAYKNISDILSMLETSRVKAHIFFWNKFKMEFWQTTQPQISHHLHADLCCNLIPTLENTELICAKAHQVLKTIDLKCDVCVQYANVNV